MINKLNRLEFYKKILYKNLLKSQIQMKIWGKIIVYKGFVYNSFNYHFQSA